VLTHIGDDNASSGISAKERVQKADGRLCSPRASTSARSRRRRSRASCSNRVGRRASLRCETAGRYASGLQPPAVRRHAPVQLSGSISKCTILASGAKREGSPVTRFIEARAKTPAASPSHAGHVRRLGSMHATMPCNKASQKERRQNVDGGAGRNLQRVEQSDQFVGRARNLRAAPPARKVSWRLQHALQLRPEFRLRVAVGLSRRRQKR